MKPLMTGLMLAALLGGCASGSKLSGTEKLALHREHAGAPVNSFRYFGSLTGWTPLGDTALAVWTRPSEAYLLELTGPCQDLDFAPAIGITNHMGQVSTRFDDVLVHTRSMPGPRMPCRIQTIRPLDVKALRASQKEMREAAAVEREAGTR